MRNVQSKPGIASRMKRGALALAAIVGTTAATHARTDLSQGGSDGKVESGEKTVKCCPIVVPPERPCRSPLKPVPKVQKKSWSGSWNYWRKAKAEAKARAMAKAKITEEAKAKEHAKASMDTKPKANAEAYDQARAKIDARARREAEAKERTNAKTDAKSKTRSEAYEQAGARSNAAAEIKEQARTEEPAKAKDDARAKTRVDGESRARRAKVLARALAKARSEAISWLWRK